MPISCWFSARCCRLHALLILHVVFSARHTKYFQNRCSHRKRKNTFKALVREDGSRCTKDEGMREMAATFNGKLFISEGSANANQLLENIEPAMI